MNCEETNANKSIIERKSITMQSTLHENLWYFRDQRLQQTVESSKCAMSRPRSAMWHSNRNSSSSQKEANHSPNSVTSQSTIRSPNGVACITAQQWSIHVFKSWLCSEFPMQTSFFNSYKNFFESWTFQKWRYNSNLNIFRSNSSNVFKNWSTHSTQIMFEFCLLQILVRSVFIHPDWSDSRAAWFTTPVRHVFFMFLFSVEWKLGRLISTVSGFMLTIGTHRKHSTEQVVPVTHSTL